MAEQVSASETQKAVKEHDPIKKLIDQGKESGFLTYEEINRRLPEGVIGAKSWMSFLEPWKKWASKWWTGRKTFCVRPRNSGRRNPAPDLGVETTNSIRMYLTEMGKVPLSPAEQELTLTRNIKENERR